VIFLRYIYLAYIFIISINKYNLNDRDTEVWPLFIHEVNAHIRVIRRLYIPETIGPVLTLLQARNKQILESRRLRVDLGLFKITTTSGWRLGIIVARYKDSVPNSIQSTPRITFTKQQRNRNSLGNTQLSSIPSSTESRPSSGSFDSDANAVPYSGRAITSTSDPVFEEIGLSQIDFVHIITISLRIYFNFFFNDLFRTFSDISGLVPHFGPVFISCVPSSKKTLGFCCLCFDSCHA
jgi:hypothetical protein